MKKKLSEANLVREFFVRSDLLDHSVLRPLDHIRANWELTWDAEEGRYAPEEGSYADLLNQLIEELSIVAPPRRYHDNEDCLAEYVIERLNWKIKKEKGRWTGENYALILEQGAFSDIDQEQLILAAAGRIRAAFVRKQLHFDEMELSHQEMLAAVLSIILYHRWV